MTITLKVVILKIFDIMKKILVFALSVLFSCGSWAQLPGRMPLPQLKFSSQKQGELYARVSRMYSESEAYGFEDEDYSEEWTKHPRQRMGAAFAVTLMQVHKSLEGVSAKDVAVVARNFLDNYLSASGVKVPYAYPFNYKAYKKAVESFLEPVGDRMTGGSQFEMNQYAYADSEMSRFLSVLNTFLAESRFKPSNLRAALEAEEEAWLKLRDCLGDVVYNYKVEINGGIGYSMLPLEVAGVRFRADERRNESAGIMHAISREDVGAVVLPMDDEVYDSILENSLREIEKEGRGVDITELVSNWKKFHSCRNEVAAYLSESSKSLYDKDTQMYMKFISYMAQAEN